MNGEELILITGATGFLGVQVIQKLLDCHPDASLALLIRDRAGQSGQQRADLIVPPSQRSRVQVYSGDVSLPNCGLDATTYERLSAEATRVIHSAATVRFDHSLDEARHINVEGTRRLLDFAAGCASASELCLCRNSIRCRGTVRANPRKTNWPSGKAIATPTNRPKQRLRLWCGRASARCPA